MSPNGDIYNNYVFSYSNYGESIAKYIKIYNYRPSKHPRKPDKQGASEKG